MKNLVIALVILLLFVSPSTVKADIAPPAQPPGVNPVPGTENTQVRMVSEIVVMDVLPDSPPISFGRARVTADFTMHNTGTKPELMDVRFPVSVNDGRGNYPEIKDLTVKVDGVSTPTQRISLEDLNYGSRQTQWAQFKVNFPPGKDVSIVVRYTLEAVVQEPFIWFDYIFSTGAGWQGNIGSAELVVTLPYEINNQNVVFTDSKDYSGTTQGAKINGNEMRWSYKNFEPTDQDNFKIELVMPKTWQDILDERAYVKLHPKDGEAWGRLGKLYKQITFSPKGRGFRMYGASFDEGAQLLYHLSVQAYEKAVVYKPDDPLWHAGFADLLGYYAYYANFEGIPTTSEAVRSLQEIQTALALAPIDAKIHEIADELTFFFPDGIIWNGDVYNYPWLTATPLPPTPTFEILIPTDTPTLATPTERVLPTTTKTPSPDSKPGLPLCGSFLIIPLGLFLLWLKRA
jgi:hypothetical protein